MDEVHNTPTIEDSLRGPVLKVLGLGGGGGNAVDRMIELGLTGVEFITANTDAQALAKSLAPTKVQLGPNLTRGLGAGGDHEVGYAAAKESRQALKDALEGADMVFLAAGMGGGTGTGAIAVAGEVARSLGAVTIAVVTTPFGFEMGRRQNNAQEGLARLQQHTDTLIAIPNDRLLYAVAEDLPLDVAFRLADDVLRQAVQGIAELATQPGLINVDFAHIRNMMRGGGGALMAIGHGQGDEKVFHAIQNALNHPLLESISLEDATGVIANFSGAEDLSLYEVGEAIAHLTEMTSEGVDVVMGVTQDERMRDRAQVILIVTGLGAKTLAEILPGAERLRPPAPISKVRNELPDTEPVSAHADEIEEELQFEVAQPVQESLPVAAMHDLDVPTFLRKRVRENVRLQEEQ